ncbi:MAG: PRC-barrel domain-containing protein [Clostridia bacterium]|nr:PRC-barrel domain-containing protein [Clostridia bacterium]
MEFSYNSVKKMDVVNISDGKHLGKTCDVIFDYPENRIQGFYVTGGKGFHLTRQDIFLPLSAVIRIGEDVILTDIKHCVPFKGKRGKERRPRLNGQPQVGTETFPDRRSYDEYE